MARLFSKDYHERSNSWYFNHVVIGLDKDDLLHWKYVDENDLIHLRFFPAPDKKKQFPAAVDIVYNPSTAIIEAHKCSVCTDEEACRHYLSVLRFAYFNLKTDIFEGPIVETCFGNALRADEEILRSLDKTAIALEGVFNPETDKIRFYYDSYGGMDLDKLIRASLNESPDELSLHEAEEQCKQLAALGDDELHLWQYVHNKRASHSSKGMFYSIHKKDFPGALAFLQRLGSMAVVRETTEALHFHAQPYNLSFRIEAAGKKNYRLSPIIVDELSVWFAGFPSWLFFRNQVYTAYLPLANDVIDAVFGGQLILKEKDLVYYRAIVSHEMRKYDIYLDFDERIELPLLIDETPRIRLQLSKIEDSYRLAGWLRYSNEALIPLSVVRFKSPLIRTSFDDGTGEQFAWFRIPTHTVERTEKLLKSLPSADLFRLEQFSELVFSGEESIAKLKSAIFELSEEDWDIVIDPEIEREFVYKARLEVEIDVSQADEIDWFAYNVRYRYKDLSFTHEELKKFFQSKAEFLHTQDGRMIFISNPGVIDEVNKLLGVSELKADQTYRARLLNLPYYQRLGLDNPEISVRGDSYLQTMFTELLARKRQKEENLPSYLQAVLRGYQKSGVSWLNMLAHYRLNGILADEMGLGKTIQALTVLVSAPAGTCSLVICPKTLLYNWAAEIEKFHTNISYQVVEGNKATRLETLELPNVQLFIMSYSLVLGDIATLKEKQFHWVVLDEAQNIKNVSAQRTSAIKKLNSKHRMALSGTPIENNLTELWSIFDFLMPGYLGNLNNFKKDYIHSDDWEQNRNRLNRLVSPFILRRVKKEVLLELPDKQEQVSWCKLNPLQEKLYLQILEGVHKKLFPSPNAPEPSYIHILTALTKLRQVCNHPSLANPDVLPNLELSAKLEMLMEILRDSLQSGHKVLVFSQFVQMLRIIRNQLNSAGIDYAYLDGQTKDRMGQVNRFNSDPELKVFLISLKAGGTGLNLTSADTVILYDPWWNPQVEQQAIDRTHRIGQMNKVNVFRLITMGTVEEKIMRLQEGKRELFNSVIEEGQQMMTKLGPDDIRGFFQY